MYDRDVRNVLPTFVCQNSEAKLMELLAPFADRQEDEIVFSDRGAKPKCDLEWNQRLQASLNDIPIYDFILAAKRNMCGYQAGLYRIVLEPYRLKLALIREKKTSLTAFHRTQSSKGGYARPFFQTTSKGLN
jgi:hypothetical protein